MLEYLYNPRIPSYLLMPSSLRASSWTQFAAGRENLEQIAGLYESLADPVTIAGIEREMITPDANTGGYYTYDTDRVLILFRRGTDRVLLSVSRQKDASEVGRKGGVVGDDANWNYLFSEECGLTRSGLGWVKSYMYGACSVTVYVQPDDPKKPLRVAMYKWLRAGWAGMNMVKENHILGGVKRYVSAAAARLGAGEDGGRGSEEVGVRTAGHGAPVFSESLLVGRPHGPEACVCR